MNNQVKIKPVVNINKVINRAVQRLYLPYLDNVYNEERVTEIVEQLSNPTLTIPYVAIKEEFVSEIIPQVSVKPIARNQYVKKGIEIINSPGSFIVLLSDTEKRAAETITIDPNQTYTVQQKDELPLLVPQDTFTPTTDNNINFDFNSIDFETSLRLLNINYDEYSGLFDNKVTTLLPLEEIQPTNRIKKSTTNGITQQAYTQLTRLYELDVNKTNVSFSSISWDVQFNSTQQHLLFYEQDIDDPFKLRVYGYPLHSELITIQISVEYNEEYSSGTEIISETKKQYLTDTALVRSLPTIVLDTNIRMDNEFLIEYNGDPFNFTEGQFEFSGDIPQVTILNKTSDIFVTAFKIKETDSLPDFLSINYELGTIELDNTKYINFLGSLSEMQGTNVFQRVYQFTVDCEERLSLEDGIVVRRTSSIVCYLNISNNSDVIIQPGSPITPPETLGQGNILSDFEYILPESEPEILDTTIIPEIPAEDTSTVLFGFPTKVESEEIGENIFTLLPNSSPLVTGSFEVVVQPGSETCVFAVPYSSITLQTIEQIIVPGDFKIDITSIFSTRIITVTDSNNMFDQTSYKLYIFTPPEPYQASATYRITF